MQHLIIITLFAFMPLIGPLQSGLRDVDQGKQQTRLYQLIFLRIALLFWSISLKLSWLRPAPMAIFVPFKGEQIIRCMGIGVEN